jgi:hypothetical protein
MRAIETVMRDAAVEKLVAAFSQRSGQATSLTRHPCASVLATVISGEQPAARRSLRDP